MGKLKENLTLRKFFVLLGIIIVGLGIGVGLPFLIWFLFFKDKGEKRSSREVLDDLSGDGGSGDGVSGNGGSGSSDNYLIPSVEREEQSLKNYNTYSLYLTKNNDNVKNVYAIYGDSDNPLVLSPAYVYSEKAFVKILHPQEKDFLTNPNIPTSEYDNLRYSSHIGFLSAEIDEDGNPSSGSGIRKPPLSIVGKDTRGDDGVDIRNILLNDWEKSETLVFDDVAIFTMEPNEYINDWNNNRMLVGKLTIRNDVELRVEMNVQGKLNTITENDIPENYNQTGIIFEYAE